MDQEQQQKLCEVLRAQSLHYQEILTLSKTQSQLIAEGKILELFPVFTKINELMALVQELDTTITEAKAAWEQQKHELPEEQRQPIATEVEKISELLKEIIALEHTQQESIGEQQKRNRTDVSKINRGQQMAKAYGQAYKPPPKLDNIVDKKS